MKSIIYPSGSFYKDARLKIKRNNYFCVRVQIRSRFLREIFFKAINQVNLEGDSGWSRIPWKLLFYINFCLIYFLAEAYNYKIIINQENKVIIFEPN